MLKNAKLKTKIIGIVCMLLAVVCIGFGVASYRTSANAIEKRVNESLPQIAEDAGKLINARLAVYFVGIDTAANRLVIRSMDWSKQLPALKEEISRQGFMEMGVATPDGKTRYTDGTTADLGDRDYFKSALAGKVVMSDVVISRVTGKPVIMMAAPITVDGHAVGVLLARVDGQLLSEISDNVKFGDIGYSYIINAKGVLIAHRKREFVTDSRNFLEEGKTKPEFSAVSKMLQRMVKGEKGYDLYPFAGAENYFGFAPIPNTGWSVAVGALKSEVLEDVYEMKTTFALLSLGFLVAGALVAFALAQSIAVPVNRLVTAAVSISNGDLSATSGLNQKDEIGVLDGAIKAMVAALIAKMGEADEQAKIAHHETEERVQMELDLEYRATHDLLTGFFNKAFYKEQLSQTIARAHAEDGAIAVLLMDLDRFKQVNDSFGHPAGDRLLQNVAERLLHMVGSDQLIARTGGDEFMFILEGENAAAQAERLAKNILSSATQCFTVDNSQIYITASIGISLYPGDGLTADMLIKNADLAMYRSKERGKNTYTFFTKELDDAVNAKFELETELFAAIEDENFEVFYQPKVDATTNSIVGCEALVRWKLPDGRYVSPADFISLAEETGLIVGIDRIVLQTVCKDLNDFSALFTTPPPVAVNISARSIAQENFVEDFLATVDGYKVAHEMIGVEITETVLMTDLEVSINSISRLDKQGFRIFLDDFGTGYSSLSYLHSMPISCLKIDKRFVDEIFSQQNKSDKIVTTIINLASSLDVDVIAEGVETKEQLGFLVKNKCNIIQGYLYSKPLPKDDYIKFCLNFSKPVAAEVQ